MTMTNQAPDPMDAWPHGDDDSEHEAGCDCWLCEDREAFMAERAARRDAEVTHPTEFEQRVLAMQNEMLATAMKVDARMLEVGRPECVGDIWPAPSRPVEKTPTLAEVEDDAIPRAVLDEDPTREIVPLCGTCRTWGWSCCKLHGAKERASR
jgi:hypothetical protein